MKKILLVLLLAFALTACVAEPAPPANTAIAQGLVALPEEASLLILSLITAAVTWVLLKVNMGQFTQPLAAAIAPIIVTAVEAFLGTIPSVFDNLVLSLLHLLVLFVGGSIGTFVLFQRAKTPQNLLGPVG